jgi:c-di-GMP-binding flagellar brake protein YcgR
MHERRRNRRFSMEQTVILRLQNNKQDEISGTTASVSEGGMLLLIDRELARKTRVDLTLLLSRGELSVARLFASGTIVRVENDEAGKKLVAVECNQPLHT